MADLFAFDGILLVGKREGRVRDGLGESVLVDGTVFVMQRCVEGGVDAVVDGELHVAETEGLAAAFSVWGEEVFCWAKEPEECNDDEVDGVGLEVSKPLVVEVEGIPELADDGDVDGVGTRLWRVFVSEACEEIIQYGIELACSRVDAGILSTQVGEPLPNGGEGVRYCLSADLLPFLTMESVEHGEGEEVVELLFRLHPVEGTRLAFAVAEVRPDAEDLVFGSSSFGSGSFACILERTAEIISDSALSGRERRIH